MREANEEGGGIVVVPMLVAVPRKIIGFALSLNHYCEITDTPTKAETHTNAFAAFSATRSIGTQHWLVTDNVWGALPPPSMMRGAATVSMRGTATNINAGHCHQH